MLKDSNTSIMFLYKGASASRNVSTAATPSRRPNNSGNKPLFSLYSYENQKIYTLDELSDIYELCKSIKTPNARESVYVIYNLDAEMVEKYYDTVMHLEKCLTKRFSKGVTRLHYKKKK